jgi:hypothetical protein
VRFGRSPHDNEVLPVDEAARSQIGEKGLAALVGRAHRGAVGKGGMKFSFAARTRHE